ncbi:sulfatase [Metabacillus indicus]|uniref:sulfatase family protein n=1 Tax=Metabacillus indicus TaxID=246786 RepID=UPI0039843C15
MSSKPNIIFIMSDQQRFDTIREFGFDYMHTPNLDALAKKGTMFSNTFTNGATCVVSRASLFTGMHPHNTGVYTFDNWSHQRTWIQDLSEAGYYCVNIGKMHVQPRDEPAGFHERFVVENPTSKFVEHGQKDDEWGGYLSTHGKERPNDRHLKQPDWKNLYQSVPWELDEHLHPDIFVGDKATEWINEYTGTDPFFLQIGFTGPHEPYDPLERHLDLYLREDVPSGIWMEKELTEKPPQHLAHQTFHDQINHESTIAMKHASQNDIQEMRRHYFAKVSMIDEKIGEIMDALDQKGYLENAVVIFTSDHGDMLGDHKLPYKWLMYDSIVHVPMIVWDTRMDRSASKKQTQALVSLIDIGPTLLTYAGISPPDYLEGSPFNSLLEQQSEDKLHEFVFCQDNYLTMIRSHTHKMVYYTEQQDSGELYDLIEDPDELNNLFSHKEYSGIKQKMKDALLNWLLKSTYLSAPYHNLEYQKKRRRPVPPYFLHS